MKLVMNHKNKLTYKVWPYLARYIYLVTMQDVRSQVAVWLYEEASAKYLPTANYKWYLSLAYILFWIKVSNYFLAESHC